MEEYLLTHGMLTQVEAWMLELLGNDLTAQGRQSLADILTVKESYLAAALSAIHQRYGTVDAWLAAEYQLTAPVRAAAAGPAAGKVTARYPRGERCFGRLPDRGSRGDREKNVISYTSDLPVQRNAHIMRSHLLSQSLTKACVALISHTTLKTMKLSTLLAAAFAIVGFLQYSVCCHLSFANRWQPFGWSESGHYHSG